MQKLLKNVPLFVCYLVAFVFGMKQLREPDIWWQLLSGKWMLEHGAVTKSDVFSYTMQGTKWVNVKWLYEVIIATIEKGFGPEGIMLLQALVNVAILWLLFQIAKQLKKYWQLPSSPFFTIISALLFFVVVEYRMAGRPEMISHLMCALMLWHFCRKPQPGRKDLVLPVILQCLWANMHEGYPIGMVMIATFGAGSIIAYLASRDKIHLQTAGIIGVLFVLAALAILVNPNGIQLWKQPFEIYRQVNVNKYTLELYDACQPQYWTMQAKLYIGMLVAVTSFWIVWLLQAKKDNGKRFSDPLTVSYLLLVVLFGYLSLTANRNIPFAAIVLFPSLPVIAALAINKTKLYKTRIYAAMAKRALVLGSIITIAVYMWIVSDQYYKATGSGNRYGLKVDSRHVPLGAVDFISRHNINGLPFSDYFISSYLLWAMYPDFKSYIDLRDLDIFPSRFFDAYFKLYHEPYRFNDLDKKYNFNYIVLSGSQLTELQKQLYRGAEYNMIYADEIAVVFLKNSPQNAHLNNDLSIQKLFSDNDVMETPAWALALSKLLNPVFSDEEDVSAVQPVNAAKFYGQLEQVPLAIKQLLPAMSSLQSNAEAQLVMGDLYLKYAQVTKEQNLQKQRLDSSYYYLNTAQELDPGMWNTYSSLGNWYLANGNFIEAEKQLEQCVDINSTNDYLYYLLGFSKRMVWQQTQEAEKLDEIIAAMKRSLSLNPMNSKALLYMAEAELNRGDNEATKKHLYKAIKNEDLWTPEETELINSMKVKLGIS